MQTSTSTLLFYQLHFSVELAWVSFIHWGAWRRGCKRPHGHGWAMKRGCRWVVRHRSSSSGRRFGNNPIQWSGTARIHEIIIEISNIFFDCFNLLSVLVENVLANIIGSLKVQMLSSCKNDGESASYSWPTVILTAEHQK